MITVAIDQAALTAVIKAIGETGKQARFAAANALNRTGEEINADLRRTLPSRFAIRERKILHYIAPVQLPRPNRATKTNLNAILQADGLAKILGPFEEGAIHVGTPLAPVAIPTSALRRSRMTIVPRSLYPVNLGLVARRDPSGKSFFALGRGAKAKNLTPFHGIQIRGKLGSFVLDPTTHKGITSQQWGVYQRLGGKVRMLWRYIVSVRRPPRLLFAETAQRIMAERFETNFTGALAQALRTARP